MALRKAGPGPSHRDPDADPGVIDEGDWFDEGPTDENAASDADLGVEEDVLFEALRDPLTLGRCLDHDARLPPLTQELCQARPLRSTPPFDDLAALGENADLTVSLMHIDANMVHGWPPRLRL